jgi:hypothetical protein
VIRTGNLIQRKDGWCGYWQARAPESGLSRRLDRHGFSGAAALSAPRHVYPGCRMSEFLPLSPAGKRRLEPKQIQMLAFELR